WSTSTISCRPRPGPSRIRSGIGSRVGGPPGDPPRPVVALFSGPGGGEDGHCGVAAYTRRLHDSLAQSEADLEAVHVRIPNGRPSVWARALSRVRRRVDVLHVQYPCEAWRWSVAPGLVPVIARRAGCRLVVTLHEWSA